jgi:hypothetical protein
VPGSNAAASAAAGGRGSSRRGTSRDLAVMICPDGGSAAETDWLHY